jgi:hypothetical protein
MLSDFFMSLGFNLANTFAGNAEFFANFFECMLDAVN